MSVLILPDQPKYVAWRHRMVAQLKQRGITDKKVLDAMDKLPRHWFVGETLLDHILYDVDQALTIDCGQTISKPYTVAWQTQLHVRPCPRYLWRPRSPRGPDETAQGGRHHGHTCR